METQIFRVNSEKDEAIAEATEYTNQFWRRTDKRIEKKQRRNERRQK